MEIYVDDQAKLTLHGLLQHYVNLPEEKQKNRKLFDLLDQIDFNQVRERESRVVCLLRDFRLHCTL
jgi:hypothetical protein